MLYKEDWLIELEHRSLFASATEKGLEKGLKKGLKKGHERGVQSAKIAMIKRFILNLGFTDEQIVLALEMSLEEVQEIRRELLGIRN